MTDHTQQRLLEAAEEVFADKGFNAASVREICKRAGANIAAVNYYFGDKEHLYIETVKYAHRVCTAGEPFPEWGPEVPARQKLADFIRGLVARMLTPQSPASLQLMAREMAQPTSACVHVVQEYIRPMAEKLGEILAELVPDLPEPSRFLIGFSIVGQCLFYRNQRAVASLLVGEEEFAKLGPEIITQHITWFTFNALGLKDVPSPAQTGGATS